MTGNSFLEMLHAFMRRQWLIALVAMTAAFGVGYFLAGDIPDRYTGKATLKVDSSTLSRFPALVGPEALLASVGEDDFIGEAADRVELTPEDLSSGLRIYNAGDPIAMFIEFVSDDEAEAERVSTGVAEFVVEWQARLSEIELDRQRTTVADTRLLLGILSEAQGDTGWEQADLEVREWSARVSLATNEAILAQMEGAYSLQDTPVVAFASGIHERLTLAVGAGIVGLLVGLLIGAVRERRMLAADT